MMRIPPKAWLGFILLALGGALLWAKFMYPQFRMLRLAIDRPQAVARADEYLRMRGVDSRGFLRACVFESDDQADRFLQKSIGPAAEEAFLARHRYELFSWNVRFFKPLQKEEYYVTISPSSGEVIGFEHVIEETARIPFLPKEEARLKAEQFLKDSLAIKLGEYDFHEDKERRLDNRTDYVFTWEKRGVHVPWPGHEGQAKLLASVRVSGDQVSAFYEYDLDVPDSFLRYCRKERSQAGVLFAFNMIVILGLTGLSSYIAFKMRSYTELHLVMRWYLAVAVFLIAVRVLSFLNSTPEMLFGYLTSSSLQAYVSTYALNSLILLAFYCLMFVMPALAGESLRRRHLCLRPHLSFAHYIKGSFFTRSVAGAICAGYLIFCSTIGLQAVLLYLGQSYAGVWKEWARVTEFSSAYFPLLSVFALSVSASFSEEIIYRLFGVTAGMRYLKKAWLAVVLAACAWGLGHAMYPIFPAWYRVAEVSVIGVAYGFIFLRLGIIPLIVAHYLVDVFWGVMGYLFGHVGQALFFGSVGLLLIPLGIAAIAYRANRKEIEEAPASPLDALQQYNLEVLVAYVAAKHAEGKTASAVSQELLAHQWEADLVGLAIRRVFAGQ